MLLPLFLISFYLLSKILRELGIMLLPSFKFNEKQLLLVIYKRLKFSFYAI